MFSKLWDRQFFFTLCQFSKKNLKSVRHSETNQAELDWVTEEELEEEKETALIKEAEQEQLTYLVGRGGERTGNDTTCQW